MALTCTNVTLRQRVISNGRISLYLDYYPAIRNPYTMKMSRREYLGIYIYARPKNEIERDFNNEMLSKAEAIRCIRVQAIVNEEFGFLDKHKMKADFLAYFREKAKLKYHKWDCVYQHFEKFVNGYCTFGDVTVELCQKFRQYLLNCKQIRHPNISVSRNSAAGYFSTFRALLKIAYQVQYSISHMTMQLLQNKFSVKSLPQDVPVIFYHKKTEQSGIPIALLCRNLTSRRSPGSPWDMP